MLFAFGSFVRSFVCVHCCNYDCLLYAIIVSCITFITDKNVNERASFIYANLRPKRKTKWSKKNPTKQFNKWNDWVLHFIEVYNNITNFADFFFCTLKTPNTIHTLAYQSHAIRWFFSDFLRSMYFTKKECLTFSPRCNKRERERERGSGIKYHKFTLHINQIRLDSQICVYRLALKMIFHAFSFTFNFNCDGGGNDGGGGGGGSRYTHICGVSVYYLAHARTHKLAHSLIILYWQKYWSIYA